MLGSYTLNAQPVDFARLHETKGKEAAAFIDERAKAILPAVQFFESLNPSTAKDESQTMRLYIFNAMKQCDLFHTEAEAKLHKLHAELANAREKAADNDNKFRNHESLVANERNQLSTKKMYFEQKTNDRVNLVNQLNATEIANIIVADQRDKVNHMFLWILEGVYQEQISKYYWTNFKNQALLKDQGVNLKERLRTLKIASMTTSVVEGASALAHEKTMILEDMRAKGNLTIPPSIETLFRIVENVEESRKLYNEYTEHEKNLKKLVDDFQYTTLEKDKWAKVQEHVKQRIEVLSNCLIYYNNFLQSLLRREDKMLGETFVKTVMNNAQASPPQSASGPTPNNGGQSPTKPPEDNLMKKSISMTSPQQVRLVEGGEKKDEGCSVF